MGNWVCAIVRFKPLAVVFVLSLLAMPVFAGETGVCRYAKLDELPITELSDAIAVPGTINGETALMQVATGRPFTFFYSDRLAVHYFEDGHGNKLTIGGLSITNFGDMNMARWLEGKDKDRITRFPADGLPRSVVGVVGEDFWSHLDLEIDLKNKKLTLYKGIGCSQDSKPLETDNYVFIPFTMARPLSWPRVIMTVEVNGHPLSAVFGTEYSDTRLTLESAKSIGIDIEQAKPIVADVNSAAGGDGLWLVQLASFSIGEEAIKPVRLRVGGRGPGLDSLGYPGTITVMHDATWDVALGLDFLRAHRVLISHSERRFYFTFTGGKIFDREPVAP